jgi:hypothetical protein
MARHDVAFPQAERGHWVLIFLFSENVLASKDDDSAGLAAAEKFLLIIIIEKFYNSSVKC